MKVEWYLSSPIIRGITKIKDPYNSDYSYCFKFTENGGRNYHYDEFMTTHTEAAKNQDLKCIDPNGAGDGFTGGQQMADDLNTIINTKKIQKRVIEEIFQNI